MTLREKYEFMADEFGGQFVNGGVAVGGYNDETMSALLYYMTGYVDFDLYIEDYYGDDDDD